MIDIENEERVSKFISWLESKVAVANPIRMDLWLIKINNDELTDKDKEMISLLDKSTSDFISLLHKREYDDFEVSINSITYTNCTEIRYTKKYE